MRVHAILSSYNRKDQTVACLESLSVAAEFAGLDTTCWLYDDGSTDGTPDAVREWGGDVHILNGTGDAFWARGMAMAESAALRSGSVGDWILWLNDDVRVDPHAFRSLSRSTDRSSIYVGNIVGDGELPTYGGLKHTGRHPLSFSLSSGPGEEVDAFNGNFVLVAIETARILGGIDRKYAHGMADIDYAIRARSEGVHLRTLPGVVGHCARNYYAPQSTLSAWRAFVGRKGAGQPQSLARLLRVIAPRTWLFWVAEVYAAWWLRALLGRHRPDPVGDRAKRASKRRSRPQ